MVKMAIVEDDKIVLDNLLTNIDWKALGTEVIFFENNGRKALQRMIREPVDIILSDIDMPIMDGFELYQKMIEFFPNIQIIFLAGYEDVGYMRTAIQLNVVAYITKPFHESTLKPAMLEAIKRLNHIKNAEIGKLKVKEYALSKILFLDEKDFSAFSGRYLMFLTCIRNFIAYYNKLSTYEIVWIIEDVKQKLESFLAVRTEEYVVCYLLEGQFLMLTRGNCDFYTMSDTEISELEDEIGNHIFLDFYFPKETQLVTAEYFKESFEDVTNELSHAFYYLGRHSTISSGRNQYKMKFLYEFALLDIHQRERLIQSYFECASVEMPDRDAIYSECFVMIDRILNIGEDYTKESANDKMKRMRMLSGMENLYQLETHILDILRKAYNYDDGAPDGTEDIQIVNKIREYIHKNYFLPISAESFVKQYYFASNTIRTIFKKYTGKTIHEYLTETRMNHAKLLLEDKTLRIKDISEMVGYDNVSYFCTKFSKLYHMTPLNYRKRLFLRQHKDKDIEC